MAEPDFSLMMELLHSLQKEMREVKALASSTQKELTSFRGEANRRLESIEKRQLDHSSDITSLRMEVSGISETLENIGLAITKRK